MITTVQFQVAGLTRVVDIRDTADFIALGAPAPTDCVIWLHGATFDGPFMLQSQVTPDARRIDVAPTGLTSDPAVGGEETWVLPGQPASPPNLVPEAVADGTVTWFHDLFFLCTIIHHIRTGPAYSAIRRIWLAGQSKGASLTWAAYAFNNQASMLGWSSPLAFVRGYWMSCCGSPRYDDYGWDRFDAAYGSSRIDWDALGLTGGGVVTNEPRIRPCGFWHGSATGDRHSQDFAYCKEWVETADDLIAAHQALGWNDTLPGTEPATGWHTFSARPVVCTATEHPGDAAYPDDGLVKARYALKDPALSSAPPLPETAPVVEFEVIDGLHTWTRCLDSDPNVTEWDESMIATEFFARQPFGLGTP